jgi:uncharacterized protein YfdQ (DUF2303 family)
MSNDNNAEFIFGAGASSVTGMTVTYTPGQMPVSVLPPNYSLYTPDLNQVERWLGRPIRKRGKFAFVTAESFARYLNEHKTEDTRVFADIDCCTASFKGVLNFHGKEPSFGDHECTLALSPTREWTDLLAHDQAEFTQVEFAAFLEERTTLFATPSGADLLELIQTLEAKADVRINQAVKLQSGAIKVRFDEDVTIRGGGTGQQAGEMELPSTLTLNVQPFEGAALMSVAARLRYKIGDRKIILFYKLINPHLIVRQVANDVVSTILAETGIEPFMV